jgi:hypothetical protein
MRRWGAGEQPALDVFKEAFKGEAPNPGDYGVQLDTWL